MNNKKYTMKDILTYSLIGTILLIGIFSFPVFKLQDHFNQLQESNEHLVHLESFSDNYVNNSDESVKIRYKYSLTNEKADSVSPEDWDNEKPLFSLYENGLLASSNSLYTEFSGVIPDVSNTYSVKPGESTDIEFEVMLNKDANEFKDLVRFEVEIIIEEFKNQRWSPVHKVVFMQRGPYWKLDKGPIELTP